jgi:hypothetical protein
LAGHFHTQLYLQNQPEKVWLCVSGVSKCITRVLGAFWNAMRQVHRSWCWNFCWVQRWSRGWDGLVYVRLDKKCPCWTCSPRPGRLSQASSWPDSASWAWNQWFSCTNIRARFSWPIMCNANNQEIRLTQAFGSLGRPLGFWDTGRRWCPKKKPSGQSYLQQELSHQGRRKSCCGQGGYREVFLQGSPRKGFVEAAGDKQGTN